MKNIEKYNNEIKIFRKNIDIIDAELIEVFKKRFEIVKDVGRLKKDFEIKPLQKKRWEEVLNGIVKRGEENNISKEFIVDVWERIHEESLLLEK